MNFSVNFKTVLFWVAGILFTTNVWALNAPSSLSAVAASSSQINLSWQDNATNESGYIIQRSLNSSSGFSEIARTSVNSVAFSNTNLAAGTYYYRVRGFRNRSGSIAYSSYSNIASATAGSVVINPPPPTASAPTISSFTANSSTISAGQSVTLSWSVSNATSLQINPGAMNVTGTSSIAVLPMASTAYTLTATNAVGSVSQSVNVTVTVSPPATNKTVSFSTNPSYVANPERGFHHWLDMSATQSSYSTIYTKGERLAILVARLDSFRSSDLSASFLSSLSAQFGFARIAGVKVNIKFAYNDGPYPNSLPDASESWILRHIGQLKPVLVQNSDVIGFVQAGFIGAWGEWHSSTNNLLDFNLYPNAAKNILAALLEALPQGLFIQIRTPAYKKYFYGESSIAANEAFTSAARARVGHHNDCFLADSTDFGTFASGTAGEAERNYIGQDGLYSPIGGETCTISTFSVCANALKEFQRQRYTYLNMDYNESVITNWRNNGCFDQIRNQLGYRLELTEAQYSSTVVRGATMSVSVNFQNSGFTSPLNPRPIYLVLMNSSGSRVEFPLSNIDPRFWQPGGGSFNVNVVVPTSLAVGTYKLALWLPDPSAGLRNRADYAIQFANVGTWEASTGLNILATDLVVE